MAGRFPPSAVSALLAVGTSLIGALLATQSSAPEARNLLYAFLLAALFAGASLLFSKGESQRKEAR